MTPFFVKQGKYSKNSITYFVYLGIFIFYSGFKDFVKMTNYFLIDQGNDFALLLALKDISL